MTITPTIKFNIEDFYTDADRAVFARKKDLLSTAKRLSAEIAAINTAMENGDDADPDPQARVESLIKGIVLDAPKSWAEQKKDRQYARRDVEEALDALALKERTIHYEAGRKLAAHIKPQADAEEKELVDKGAAFHNAHFTYWSNKRALLNAGIGIYQNYLSSIDDVLGLPVDSNTELAAFFREAVKKGQLRKMPEGYSL